MKQEPFIIRAIFKAAIVFTFLGAILIVGGIAAGFSEAHHSETILKKQQ